MNAFDVRIVDVVLHLLPVTTRVPLKFGGESLVSVTCARVALDLSTIGGPGFGYRIPEIVRWLRSVNLFSRT